MTADALPPLVVTAGLSEQDSNYFNELRARLFPSHLNHVPAHLSLFHRLPGSESEVVWEKIQKHCTGRTGLPLRFTGLRNLGRGVAFTAESVELSRLHADLSHAFGHWLTPQDRQKLSPHVTVQNKVTPAEAKHALALLQAQFTPWETMVTGLMIWRYLNGPWEHVKTLHFRDAAQPTPDRNAARLD